MQRLTGPLVVNHGCVPEAVRIDGGLRGTRRRLEFDVLVLIELIVTIALMRLVDLQEVIGAVEQVLLQNLLRREKEARIEKRSTADELRHSMDVGLRFNVVDEMLDRFIESTRFSKMEGIA